MPFKKRGRTRAAQKLADQRAELQRNELDRTARQPGTTTAETTRKGGLLTQETKALHYGNTSCPGAPHACTSAKASKLGEDTPLSFRSMHGVVVSKGSKVTVLFLEVNGAYQSYDGVVSRFNPPSTFFVAYDGVEWMEPMDAANEDKTWWTFRGRTRAHYSIQRCVGFRVEDRVLQGLVHWTGTRHQDCMLLGVLHHPHPISPRTLAPMFELVVHRRYLGGCCSNL